MDRSTLPTNGHDKDSLPTITAAHFTDIIGIYVPLDRTGEKPVGYCPLCLENEKSFILEPEIGTWHCKACNKGGDIYQLFQKIRRIPEAKAVRFVSLLNQSLIDEERLQDGFLGTARQAESQRTDGGTPATKPMNDQTKAADGNEKPGKASRQAAATAPSASSPEKEGHDTPAHTGMPTPQKPPVHTAEPPIPTPRGSSDLIDRLLTKFDGTSGYLGIAIVDPHREETLGCRLGKLTERDALVIAEFMRNTIKYSKEVLGSFEDAGGKVHTTMTFATQANKQKVIWVPCAQDGKPIDILLLLEEFKPESLFLLKLTNMCRGEHTTRSQA